MRFIIDSLAAQSSTAALAGVWSVLGVHNQTDCMQKLRLLLKSREEILREAEAAARGWAAEAYRMPCGGLSADWMDGFENGAIAAANAVAELIEEKTPSRNTVHVKEIEDCPYHLCRDRGECMGATFGGCRDKQACDEFANSTKKELDQ